MEIDNRIREVQDLLEDATRCVGNCRYDSQEAVALERIIKALQAILTLLRTLARPGNRGGAA